MSGTTPARNAVPTGNEKCRPDREREIDGDPPTREELERLPWLTEKPVQEWSANG